MNSDNKPNHPTNTAVQPNIRQVDLNTVLPLRAAVLRPGQPTTAAIFPADHDPTTQPHHWALYHDHNLTCVASTYQQPLPPNTHPTNLQHTPPHSWRQLRGMATHPNHRRQGHGHTLLNTICQPPTTGIAHNIWCNARRSAVAFYEAAGFVVCSDAFDVPEIGTHYVMALRVT